LTSDVAMICGKSERSARRMLQKIKEHFDKTRKQFVTVEEFCFYSGIPIERVHEHFDRIGELRHGKRN